MSTADGLQKSVGLLDAAPYAVRRLHAAVNPTLGEAGK